MNSDIANRHRQIIDLVASRGYVSIADMASSLRVSQQTVRRDLFMLADRGLVTKVHGGAGAPQDRGDVGYDARRSRFSAEKRSIAAAIAQQIPNGATVFIDIGTTMEAVAEALLDHADLKIITNHLTVAMILSRHSEFQIILAGGILRHRDHATTGEATRAFLEQFRVGFGIFGIGGISPEGDLLDYDFRDIGVSKTALQISRRRFVAADHGKFSSDAMVRIGSLADVDALFTDRDPPQSIQSILETLDVALHVAGNPA